MMSSGVLCRGLEGVVDDVGKSPGPVLSAGAGLVGLVGGAGLLAGGLITVIPKIRDTKDALETLTPAGSRASDSAKRMAQETGVAEDAVNGKTANVYVNTYTEFHHVERSESVTTSRGPRRDGQRDAFALGG